MTIFQFKISPHTAYMVDGRTIQEIDQKTSLATK